MPKFPKVSLIRQQLRLVVTVVTGIAGCPGWRTICQKKEPGSQIAFHRMTGDSDVRQCLVNAMEGILNEYLTQKKQGLLGWGYTSCPFMLHQGPIQHQNRIDKRHSFGALGDFMALYYVCSLSKDYAFSKKVNQAFPFANKAFQGKLPNQGKAFAQATRWTPHLMYYINRLSKSSSGK